LFELFIGAFRCHSHLFRKLLRIFECVVEMDIADFFLSDAVVRGWQFVDHLVHDLIFLADHLQVHIVALPLDNPVFVNCACKRFIVFLLHQGLPLLLRRGRPG